MSTSGGGGASGIARASVHADAAAIATLFSAPLTLVPAPGAGKMISIVQAVGEFVAEVDGFADFPTPVLCYDTNAIGKLIVSLGECFPAGAPPVSSLYVQPQVDHPTAGGVGQHTYAHADVDDAAVKLFAAGSNPGRAGPIVTTTLAAGGTGYAVGDTGTIDIDPLGYTGGAAYVVDTVAAITGAVLTYHLTGAGDGYTTLSNPSPTTAGGAQAGIGTGLTVNVTAIAPADGDLYVTVEYRIVTLH